MGWSRSTVAALVALTIVALAPVESTARACAEPDAEQASDGTTRTTSIRVDVDVDLGDRTSDTEVARAIRDAVAERVASSGMTLDEHAALWMRWTVRPANLQTGAGFLAVGSYTDTERSVVERRVACDCASSELIVRIADELDAMLPAISDVARGMEERAQAGAPPPAAASTNELTPPMTERRRYRPGWLGGTGFVLAGLGIAAAIGGAVMLGLRSRSDEASSRASLLRGGAVALAGGGFFLACGLPFIALEVHWHRRGWIAAAPTLGPRIAGLSLRGKF